MRTVDSVDAVVDAATAELDKRLRFNVTAHGNPWTGEYADSEFLFPEVIVREALDERETVLAALYATLAATADEQVITCYRRMEAAALGARAERDIMRGAIEVIAGGPSDAQQVAQRALETDRKRREANLAALQASGGKSDA